MSEGGDAAGWVQHEVSPLPDPEVSYNSYFDYVIGIGACFRVVYVALLFLLVFVHELCLLFGVMPDTTIASWLSACLD